MHLSVRKILLFYFLLFPISGFTQSNCKDLPKTFYSYNEAINKVRNAKFSYVDNVNTASSSFITGASYFSCDGQFGFLIIGINNRQYIHKDLPKGVWLSFKQAKSFGTFYNQNIRNRYNLSI
jgi:hypothetical protein